MKVLWAVDGSQYSLAAGDALKCLSSVDELVLVHVIDPVQRFHPVLGYDMLAEIAATLYSEQKAEGERLLADAQSRVTSPATTRSRLETGAPVDVLLDVAKQEQVDLMVLGARGAGNLEELVLGSVSHAVVNRAEVPVLIVHEELQPVRHVLIPIASRVDAESAERFFGLAPFVGVEEFRVLTSVPLLEPLLPLSAGKREEFIRRAITEAHALVEEAGQKLARLGHRVRTQVTLGAPASSILETAGEWPADLIVMGARHRAAVTRFFLGSVSHAVLHRARVPVLVFPSRACKQEGAASDRIATASVGATGR